MAVNNQNPFQKQYVDSFQGKNVDEEELLDLPPETYLEVISQYNIDDNGNLTSKVGSGVYVPNNPAPEDRSLVEKPDPNPIVIPADQTINIGNEVAAGNVTVGGGSSVDPSTGLLRIEAQPRYNDEDRGTTGKGVSPDAPEDNEYDDDFEVTSSGGLSDDGSETGAPLGLNRDSKSVTEISNPKDAKSINASAGVFDADLNEIKIEPKPNELNVFSSYTYNIALYMLNSKSYVNLLTKPNSPREVLDDSLLLMRDGGTGTQPENALERELGFFNDFYIDNLELTNVAIGPSKRKQNTNVTDVSFTITEPRGVTLIEKLRNAAKTTLEHTKEKYIHAPYLIEIKFKGYDDRGQPMAAESKPKYIPIKITDIKFEVTSMGTEYKVRAIPYAHSLFGQINSTIPMNMELSATTIGDIFNSGGNEIIQTTEDVRVFSGPGGQEQTTQKKTVEKYGDSFKSLAEVLTDNQKKRTKPTTKKVKKMPSNPGDRSGGYEEVEVPPAAEGYDTYSFKIASQIANAKLNVEAIFDALDTPAPTGQKKDDGKANKSQFQAYAASFGGGISLDKDKKTFKINAGTDVTKLLNLVIMHSDYMDKNIDEVTEKGISEGKGIKWFKIKPVIISAEGDGKGFDGKDGRYKYHVEYVVEPSVIYYHDFPWAPKSKPKGLGYHKVYDYIFSGKNTEVLDFKLDFKTAFYQVMTAGTGSKFADKSADNDFSPLVKEQPLSAEGNSTNGKDSLTRARAKDLFSSVMSDGVDMIALDMRIIGDPAYLPTSDAYWQDKIRKGQQYTSAYMPDGTINYELSMPFCQVNLRTPVDYDDITGLANVTATTNSTFSGIYKITQISSTFSGGIFQQKLTGIRAPLQPTKNGVTRDDSDNAGKERKAVVTDLEKTTESTPIQSGGAKGEFGGITNQKATVVDTAANEDIDYGETPPYTSATVNNERTAEIARGPDQTVTTIPDVNADLSSSWNPPADVLQNAPPTFTPTPPPVRVVTPDALEDQTVETI